MSKNFSLLMDNCGYHGKDLVDNNIRVTIFTLPPNCTSLHQPMDMGVIAAWKADYRHTLLRDMIMTMEKREQRKQMSIANELKACMKGLNEGHDPHILDVSEIIDRTREIVSEKTVARFWIKAGIFTVGTQANLFSTHIKVTLNQNYDEKALIDDIL